MWYFPFFLLAIAVGLERGWGDGLGLLLVGCLFLYFFSGLGITAKLWFIGLNAVWPFVTLILREKYKSPAVTIIVFALFVTFLPLAADKFARVPMELDNGCSIVCKSNLKNLGTALEDYAVDHEGRYPAKLEELQPDYLKKIPSCIPQDASEFGKEIYAGLGVKFEDYEYEAQTEPDGYLISCPTGVHTTPTGYPKYDSVNGLTDLP